MTVGLIGNRCLKILSMMKIKSNNALANTLVYTKDREVLHCPVRSSDDTGPE